MGVLGVIVLVDKAVYFDADWYLQYYPDVAKAGVNPYQHYLTHGQFEGRQPGPNRAIAWGHHLWCGRSELMLPLLEALVAGETTPPHERVLALTELMVWYGAEQRWVDVQRLASGHEALLTRARRIDVLSLLWFEAELALGSGEAPTRLAELKQHFPTWPCAYLAEANLGSRGQVLICEFCFKLLGSILWLDRCV